MDYFTDVIEDINGGFTVFGSIYPEDGNSHDFWLVCFNGTYLALSLFHSA